MSISAVVRDRVLSREPVGHAVCIDIRTQLREHCSTRRDGRYRLTSAATGQEVILWQSSLGSGWIVAAEIPSVDWNGLLGCYTTLTQQQASHVMVSLFDTLNYRDKLVLEL